MSTTYNLVEAGAAVGRTKSAILKAIKRGAISANRNPVTGGWAIDPAELNRVFPQVSKETLGDHHDTKDTGETGGLRLLLEVERMKAAGLVARLADMEKVNDDLRHRLDTATGQLGEALQQMRVLTDQRSAPAVDSAELRLRPWWRRLVGR